MTTIEENQSSDTVKKTLNSYNLVSNSRESHVVNSTIGHKQKLYWTAHFMINVMINHTVSALSNIGRVSELNE